MNNKDNFWYTEVRNYEVDYQGIVNNANYFHYFDNARSMYLKNMCGLDLKESAERGINIVLVKTEIFFKASLTLGNQFYVESYFSRISRFKYKVIQTIYRCDDNKIMATADSIIASITKEGKPCIFQELSNIQQCSLS